VSRRAEAGRTAAGVVDQQVDDVGDASPAGVRATLPGGRAAPAERPRGQVEHLFPVAELVELGAQLADEALDGDRRRHGHRRAGQVEQVTLEAGAGGPPHRRPVQRRAGRHDRLTRAVLLPGAQHQGAEEAGQQHHGVRVRTGVGDPQFDRGHVRGRPHVEIDHLRVGDGAGGDQVRHQRVVLRGGVHHAAVTGGRPAQPDQRAHAGVPAVLAHPVRRAGGEPEQHGQRRGDPLGDGDRLVPVGDADVHLGAADELLAGEHLILVEHPAVPRGRGDRQRVEVDQRHRARGDQPEPE
jgi:hypothetical protein